MIIRRTQIYFQEPKSIIKYAMHWSKRREKNGDVKLKYREDLLIIRQANAAAKQEQRPRL